MANDFYSIIVTGRLTADPEIKSTKIGPLYKLKVAINKSKRGSDGQWKESTVYLNVNYFGNAENSERDAARLTRGAFVFIPSIELEANEFDGKDGKKVKTTDWNTYRVDTPAFIAPKGQYQNNGPQQGQFQQNNGQFQNAPQQGFQNAPQQNGGFRQNSPRQGQYNNGPQQGFQNNGNYQNGPQQGQFQQNNGQFQNGPDVYPNEDVPF